MKFISVKGYNDFEDMGFKCGDEVIILINGGDVSRGIVKEDYGRLMVYVGGREDSIFYDFYHISAIAKLNIELVVW